MGFANGSIGCSSQRPSSQTSQTLAGSTISSEVGGTNIRPEPQRDPIDYDLANRELKRFKELGKTVYPVFQKAGQDGAIELLTDGRVRWSGGAVVLGPVGGWSRDSSVKFEDRTGELVTFVNVGETPLTVGGFTLEKGQHAVLEKWQGTERLRKAE